ncbi:VOC family protein [Rhizobium sp. AQ_MP]|uniref:VOC family protein n=1 Tax=Rhizobium sp. AQ_MP TaxID=2761536 RepID=UPI00163A4AD6|nr:VOC family protein [Rhizobium sp. AQ_MP]MBC2771478.1 VOC family protein [Rhizobium sp. AQ_MP]
MIEGILETALYADDLDKAEVFYDSVLGLEKIRRGGNRHIFYRCGPGVLLIFNPAATSVPIADDPFPVPTHGTKGPGHACFFVTQDDLDAMARNLQEAGVPIESELTWPNGARSIYFRDPAGNSLECASRTLWTS